MLLIIGDFFALLAAFSVAYILRVKLDDRPLINAITARNYFSAFVTVLPLWILVHGTIGLYKPEIYERRFKELGRLLIGSFLGILVVLGYDFVSSASIFPARLVPIYGLGIGFGFLVIFRTAVNIIRRALYSYGIGVSNVLIVGNTHASDDVGVAIRDTAKTGQHVLGVVARSSTFFKTYLTFDDAIEHIQKPIHSIIQTELYTNQGKNNDILRYAQQHHISYRFVPGNSDLFVGNIAVDLFAGLPMIAVHQTALTGWGRIAKRMTDIALATTLLIVSTPFFLVIPILIKIFGGGSVFFRQQRLTRFNRTFTVYKFRTQYATYDGTTPEQAFKIMRRPELVKKYRANGDFLENDPRITPIGRFLRRTSLDELPQLINVIRGDISLVGPRALIPEELNQYEKKHTILSVKSGLTGLAQISGRRTLSFDERRKLDMYYVQNWSFWLDITILFRTLRAVLGGIGAQ